MGVVTELEEWNLQENGAKFQKEAVGDEPASLSFSPGQALAPWLNS